MEDNQSDPNIVPQKVLDRYEVIETIGTGGTGTVFKAKDTHLHRIIAIKALNPNKESAKNIVRLHKEARTICQLRHPNIVEIYDFIIANRKEPMMVMEFVEGKSLECIIAEQGAMSLRESLDIFLQICDAMDYAHSRGVLHRDLAPSNILVSPGPKGRASIKVVDFGVAKVEDLQDNTFSKTGCLVGTVTVISPEQATGRAVDARSDVYSMGCLMYRVLTGQYPLVGESLLETVNKQIHEKAPPLSAGNANLDYPKDLEDIVARALNKAPEERFQSMNELRLALEELFLHPSEHPTVEMEALEINLSRTLNLPKRTRQKRKTKLVYVIPLAVASCLALVGIALMHFDSDSTWVKTRKAALPDECRISNKNDQTWFNVEGRISDSTLRAIGENDEPIRIKIWNASVSNEELAKLLKLQL